MQMEEKLRVVAEDFRKNDRYNLLLRCLDMTTTSKYKAREESGGEPGALSELSLIHI